jgi:AraC-like DNA-binding protein
MKQKLFHGIDVVLLTLIIRGRRTHYLEGHKFKEEGVSLSVTHYGQLHSVVTDTEGIEVLNIFLDLEKYPLPKLPPLLNKILPLFLPLHPAFHNKLNKIVRITFNNPSSAVFLAMSLHRELEEKKTGFIQASGDYLRLFLMEACRGAVEKGVKPFLSDSQGNEYPAEKVRNFIDHNYQKKITLDKLAEIASTDKSYLCRMFKKYTGKSPFNYLLERRLQAAMIALRGEDAKILSIAAESGFTDVSFFNRKFKVYTGTTPENFRKKFAAHSAR